MFSTDYQNILDQMDQTDPVAYGRTRNFIDGAVTKLSPYISRGVISTKQVFQSVLDRGFHPDKIEKFIQELAWRDYWQQIWIDKGDNINQDLIREQPNVHNHSVPKTLIDATTGIHAIDQSVKSFYGTGYLHNHVRMYIACIACNIGRSHWREPAKWMYYHLLDGDWASNALSWQWVSGANARKEYYANQQNINRYCHTGQKGTFMDVAYEEFYGMEIPPALRETVIPELKTPLPKKQNIQLDASCPTLIYNWYNLDPTWHQGEKANRILLLEPSVFIKYPISKNAVDFMLGLLKNIEGIKVFVGEFSDLIRKCQTDNVIYKEHPLNNYQGVEEPRDWMFSVSGYYRSFFAFWKKCQKELKQ
ncbi:MAG: deoxyribodipyrimidine photolyase [Ekhidna sp.]|nr:deoxyribodipyrimidine photolyase [Ekhidna sp.]